MGCISHTRVDSSLKYIVNEVPSKAAQNLDDTTTRRSSNCRRPQPTHPTPTAGRGSTVLGKPRPSDAGSGGGLWQPLTRTCFVHTAGRRSKKIGERVLSYQLPTVQSPDSWRCRHRWRCTILGHPRRHGHLPSPSASRHVARFFLSKERPVLSA